MSTVEVSTPPSPTSEQLALPPRRLRRTISENLLLALMRLVGPKRAERLCIVISALRSCHGHLGTAVRQGKCLLETGPASYPNGAPNQRTLARNLGIRNLLATYPWADNLDLQLFLAGFDAGERFAAHRDTQPNKQESASAHRAF